MVSTTRTTIHIHAVTTVIRKTVTTILNWF